MSIEKEKLIEEIWEAVIKFHYSGKDDSYICAILQKKYIVLEYIGLPNLQKRMTMTSSKDPKELIKVVKYEFSDAIKLFIRKCQKAKLSPKKIVDELATIIYSLGDVDFYPEKFYE